MTHITAEDEKAAREWLNSMAGPDVTTIRRLLARPVLPDSLSDELIERVWWLMGGSGESRREHVERVFNFLRGYLTRPKTKTVWRVQRGGAPKDFDSIALAVGDLTANPKDASLYQWEVPND